MDVYHTTYSNPFPALDEQWDDYGNGDPFVMRYNGEYYLYVSTKDYRIGIKAWTSANLIDWNYIGLVADDVESTGAYAPEVTYWNGHFYLYTSPAGKGHYVYESTSPAGPFERVTDNVGMSIDGSVFIDDDGQWYFTHAGTSGIVGVPMPSPTTFDHGRVIEGAYLGHWTEGSMIIKRNGLYYMTLTGNHVFSKGYRIHYGVSDQSPLGPYIMPEHNPIAISTAVDFNGIGHSSTVLGPNMDSYYLVYHNLEGRSAEGPPVRSMNIDRLIFNGSKMDLLGTTNYPQPVPQMPELAGHLDKEINEKLWISDITSASGSVISRLASEAAFIAEYNFSIEEMQEDGILRLLFNYEDESSYDAITLSPSKQELEIITVKENSITSLAAKAILPGMDLSMLHTVRVEQSEADLKVFWDGMLQLTVKDYTRDGGYIGYEYDHLSATLYYTALSNSVAGSSDYEVLKPLPGTIEAIHYLSGNNRGFNVKEKVNHAPIRSTDGVQIEQSADGDYAIQLQHKQDWVRYGVNVAASAEYLVSIFADIHVGDATVELLLNDELVGSFDINGLKASSDHSFSKIKLGHLKLEQGFHTLTLRLAKGSLKWKNMSFEYVDTETIQIESLLESSSSENVFGQWESRDGWYIGHSAEDAKLFGGNPSWSDYRIGTRIKLGDDPSGSAGVLLRVMNESDFRDQVTDAMMGYYVAVTATKLELYKLNYDSVLLHAEKVELPRHKELDLEIEARGNTITVQIDGQPSLSYSDHNAWMVGKIGIRSFFASDIELGDLTIESIQ